MAINLNGLPIVVGPRTLTSGGPPIALNNEIRGGVHRISGTTGDTLGDIDGRYLQAGMLVFDESASEDTGGYFMYRNDPTAADPTGNPDANDPFRGADGRLPNNVGTVDIGAANSNWVVASFGGGGGGISSVTTLASAPADALVVLLTATDTSTDPDSTPGYYYRTTTSGTWARSYSNADVDARIADWAETGNTERIPDDKMSLAALERVQRVRLDGTTLRFYYGTDTSGNGDFNESLANLADFPFEHFTDITARNAFTGHGNRSIFATVSNDTGDGSADPQGTFATYVLTNPPAAGDSDQTTDNADWDRLTSPDSIINEVCVQVYNEVTGMFEERSLGTTSAVEGLTETTANGIYFRQDQRFGEIADDETARTAARTNLDVPATTDLATVEFPGSDTETRLANIEFNDAGDQITFRNAGGMTQSFTGGGGQPNGGYPTVGGIALEQLGSVTHGAGDSNSWPTGSAQVFGENADMITYTAGGGSGNQTVNGVLTNNTGSTIDIGDGVLDIDITITAITGSSLQAGFGLILPQGDATTPVVNSPFSVQLPIINASNLPARLTVRVPIQSTATSDWVNGGTIGLVVTENNALERPFSYDVNAIRLSYTSHDFHKVGAAADIVFQETDGTITSLDSISVDGSNRLLFSGPTGSLVYAGGGGGGGDVSATDVITAWTSGTDYATGRLVYTTTGDRYLPWRRNSTAYSTDTATGDAERAASPDSTDGAALWAVLPPVVNTTANSPIVVDRNGWNIGVEDDQLRRVSDGGNRLDLTPTAVTAGTYTNPHVTVDTYGRVVGALNGTALTDLPHTGYSYSRQDNLSDNLYTNRTQDVYNILGLHLAFNESAVDVAEGTEIYLFSNGNADTGTHVLTLRRNAEPETDIAEGHTFVWDVIFGFDWLEQFLGPADPGSSTRDLDLTSAAALSAFSSLYTRDTITRPAVLERLGSGEVRWVYPQDVVDDDDATANNTVTKGGINTAINDIRSPLSGFTLDTTTTPNAFNNILRFAGDNTVAWSNDVYSSPQFLYSWTSNDIETSSITFRDLSPRQSTEVSLLVTGGGGAADITPYLGSGAARIVVITSDPVEYRGIIGDPTFTPTSDGSNTIATFTINQVIVSPTSSTNIALEFAHAPAFALLDSPALTGTPTAPTATAGTNTTQLATTEFVTTAVAAGGGGGGDAGRLFSVNNRYAAGDLVSTPLGTSPITYRVWALRDGTLDGTTTALTTAQSPGGTDNLWDEVAEGTINSEYIVHSNVPHSLVGITPSTSYQFVIVKTTSGDGPSIGTNWFAINGQNPSTTGANLGTLARINGTGSDTQLREGPNVFAVSWGGIATTLENSGTPAGTADSVEFILNGSGASDAERINASFGWAGGGGSTFTLTADAVEALDLDFASDNVPQIGGVNIVTETVTDTLRQEISEEHNTNVAQNSRLDTQQSAIDINSHRIDALEGGGGDRYHTHQFFTVNAPQRTGTELLDYRSRATGTTNRQWAAELHTGSTINAAFTADSTAIPSNIGTVLDNYIRGVYHNNSGIDSYSLANDATNFLPHGGVFLSPFAILTINSTIHLPLQVVNNFRTETFSHVLQYPFPVDSTLEVTNFGVRYFTATTDWTYQTGGTVPLADNRLTLPFTPAQVTDLRNRESAGDTLVVHYQPAGGTEIITSEVDSIDLTNGTGASGVTTDYMYLDFGLLNADGTPMNPNPPAPLLSVIGSEVSVADRTSSTSGYFAPAVDTPEQMHDDLREWVSRDFEVQLNPHPDVGMVTGHTFTLGGQTGTVSNVSDNGRVFEISLTDAQRGLATTSINPANNNHIDMAFSWVHSGVTHTWTNPINLIEDLGTEQTIGDFLVRRGTQEGIEADTLVATSPAAPFYLTGGDLGTFGNLNNLGIANSTRYLLTLTNVPTGVTNLSNQVATGDTFLVTTPGGNGFNAGGVVFQTVRRVTNGVEASAAPNFALYNPGSSGPADEYVTFTLSTFSTGNPGLEIVNRENNAIIFRLSPTGDLEIAGSLTQNNVAQ